MNTQTIDIKAAHSDELPMLQHCAHAAYAGYVEKMNKTPAPMDADFRQHIFRGEAYIARRAGAFVGYIVLYKVAEHLHIDNVAVYPAYAGRGIGKQLMQYAERVALSAGLTSIELYTNEAMTENLLWYPHLGYVETERHIQDGFKRVFFRKLL